MAEREVDVRELIEESDLRSFQLVTFGLCVLTLFANGLNFSALNIAIPSILRSFDQQTSAIGSVLAFQFLGFFVGSILFGFLGDRFGRRPGIIAAVLTYSIPSLLIAWFADSIVELAFFRGIAGLGIGGLIPNVVALLNETAPKKFRVSFVMVAFVGYSFGNATIARVGAYVPPTRGRRSFLSRAQQASP